MAASCYIIASGRPPSMASTTIFDHPDSNTFICSWKTARRSKQPRGSVKLLDQTLCVSSSMDGGGFAPAAAMRTSNTLTACSLHGLRLKKRNGGHQTARVTRMSSGGISTTSILCISGTQITNTLQPLKCRDEATKEFVSHVKADPLADSSWCI